MCTRARLRALASAYLDIAVARGAGPADVEQLESHLNRSLAFAAAKETTGDDDAADMFLSARDGKSFVIRFGQSLSADVGDAATPIAVESCGRDGVKLAALANGKVISIEGSSPKPTRATMQVGMESRPRERRRDNQEAVLRWSSCWSRSPSSAC